MSTNFDNFDPIYRRFRSKKEQQDHWKRIMLNGNAEWKEYVQLAKEDERRYTLELQEKREQRERFMRMREQNEREYLAAHSHYSAIDQPMSTRLSTRMEEFSFPQRRRSIGECITSERGAYEAELQFALSQGRRGALSTASEAYGYYDPYPDCPDGYENITPIGYWENLQGATDVVDSWQYPYQDPYQPYLQTPNYTFPVTGSQGPSYAHDHTPWHTSHGSTSMEYIPNYSQWPC
ncbi:hypothetical protein BT69DRAFT_1360711 [Atractiella rhizophila]|nr:hypothetical protein BT69DRAFT_1360711 [Atractiella rhizophila]